MKTDRECLLHAVLANPDDDLPRLVFADWLNDNGEPERAEFIRIQCRLGDSDRLRPLTWREARIMLSAASRPDEYLSNRANELLARDPLMFLGGAAFDVGVKFGMSLGWSRGFVSHVPGRLADLERYLPDIVREHPVATVAVTDRRPSPSQYGSSVVWDNAGRPPIRNFAFGPHPDSVIPENIMLEVGRYCELGQDDDGFWHDSPYSCWFKDHDSAMSALNQAVLTNARKAAEQKVVMR